VAAVEASHSVHWPLFLAASEYKTYSDTNKHISHTNMQVRTGVSHPKTKTTTQKHRRAGTPRSSRAERQRRASTCVCV
jgi:hypothetical protein